MARLGADDFLILLPGVGGAENTAKVAQKVLDTFLPPLQVDDQDLHLGASLGITLYPHDGDDAETLIRNADTALYRAKEHSRGSYQFYTTDMNATAFERLILETQLRRALERGELVVHYQPQVRLDSGAVVAVEALVRWFHDDLGLISPAEFIPLAEETGLILDLGRWVLGTACAQVRAWQEQGFADLRLAVNLSGRQFEQEDLVRSIAQVIEASRLRSGRPRARADREQHHAQPRAGGRSSCRRSTASASGCRSTTSAPATPRSATSSASRSARSRSTSRSSRTSRPIPTTPRSPRRSSRSPRACSSR